MVLLVSMCRKSVPQNMMSCHLCIFCKWKTRFFSRQIFVKHYNISKMVHTCTWHDMKNTNFMSTKILKIMMFFISLFRENKWFSIHVPDVGYTTITFIQGSTQLLDICLMHVTLSMFVSRFSWSSTVPDKVKPLFMDIIPTPLLIDSLLSSRETKACIISPSIIQPLL